MVGRPVVVAVVPQGRMTLPSAVPGPASLLLPYFSLFLRTLRWRLFETLRLLSLGLRRRLLTTLLNRPFIVALLLLRSALNRLLRNLRALGLSLLRRTSRLRRHLRTLLPLGLRTTLLLRLHRLRLWWLLWLLRRLRTRFSLLWWQTLLIPVWLSLLLLLLLRSLLRRPRLFPVRFLLVLRLRRLFGPVFLFVFLLLAESHSRGAESQG